MNAPLKFHWDGEFMRPQSQRLADRQFVVGEDYWLIQQEPRSQASHAHYFASLHDAWMNLPDRLAVQFATAEALRKHALIMTGHRNERKLVTSSPAEARKFAAFLRPADEYAIVSVSGNVVIEWKAKSQSTREMGGPTFQKSKQDVLDFVAGLIGVAPDALSANAGAAA